MRVDESFTEYVAVRWSMFHRLATLLAGEDRAEALTRAALVRTYLAWPEVQESASADQWVKRALARECLKGASASPEPADASARPDDLWTLLEGLPPRHRALLVLRHHEGFFDGEVADALGCSPATVASEGHALEAGIDLAALRQEMVRRSDEVEVPPPPVDELLLAGREARRRRRRRTWTWAGAVAAAVVVAFTLASVLEGSSDPVGRKPARAPVRFLSALPAGPPPFIASSTGRLLRLGNGRQITMPELPSRIVQTRRWLLVVSVSGTIRRYDPVTGESGTVAQSSNGELVTDPAGEHVAWLSAAKGPATVVVETVTDGTVPVSDEQQFPGTPRCCDNPFLIAGITQDRRVVASMPTTGHTWLWQTPDGGEHSPVQEVTGLGTGAVREVTAAGVVVGLPLSQYAVGRLDDDGHFVRSDVLTARDAVFSDPAGRRAVVLDDEGEIRVRDIRSRGRSRRGFQDVRMLVPALPSGFAAVSWEDDDHVLLDISDASTPHGALVRCDVDTGDCELAVVFKGTRHLLAR
jgi:hypothetical protein